MASRIAKIGDKYYDLGTGNKTFLQVAKDLKTLGIENFYFMLEICDYSLINVDPFACDKDGNTTLSRDQISRIMIECARNPWYFLREIARIPDQGGTSVPYKANRGNIAQAWCICHGLDSWLCLPRRILLSQNRVIYWKNLFNYWDISSRQSAAKLLNRRRFND